jgi:hypothetical protein
MRKVAVIVKDEGTVWLFTPVSDDARERIEENVECEPRQWLGPSLGVDHRPARELMRGMQRRGLRVQGVV